MNNPIRSFQAFEVEDLLIAWAGIPDREHACQVWDNEYMVFSFFMDGSPLLPRPDENARSAKHAATEAIGIIIGFAENKPLPEFADFLRSVTWDELNGAIQDLKHELYLGIPEKQQKFCPAIVELIHAFSLACKYDGVNSNEALGFDYLLKMVWLLSIVAQGRGAIQEGGIPCD